jgi:hypothetical protein
MPFPEPETALGSMIDLADRENPIRDFIARPGGFLARLCVFSITYTKTQ